MPKFSAAFRRSRTLRRIALLVCSLALLAGQLAPAQTRVSDRDMVALMRNLRDDAKSFQSRFDDAVKKSAIRKTSQEKDAKKQVALLVKQTDELLKRFRKDRSGTRAFSSVVDTATQVDATVNSLSLGTRATDSWQRVRLAVQQLAAAYNMPSPFTGSGSGYASPAPVAAPVPISNQQRHTWLRISAFATAPLAGADVAVYDVKGKKIFERKDATNDRGVYPARIDRLPRDFRVTITADDAHQQNPDLRRMGKLTLAADVRNFDPTDGVVNVNPVTTLVSRIMDRNRQMTLGQAQGLVRALLGLPQQASLGAAMRQGPHYQSPYFSETLFMEKARQAGGLDRFIDGMASQAFSSRAGTDSFYPARVGPAAAAKWVGQNLAAAALWYVAGEGIGWAMAQGGLVTRGATFEQVEKLQAALFDLKGSVNELHSQVNSLANQISNVQLNQYVQPALALANKVHGVEDLVEYFAETCPPVPEAATARSKTRKFQAFCDQERSTIERRMDIVLVENPFKTLSDYMLPSTVGDNPGVIRMYSQALGRKVPFFRPADSARIQSMFEYWYSAQIEAANLEVEDMHMRGLQNNDPGRRRLREFLGDQSANPPEVGRMARVLAEEQALLFPPVPDSTVINTRDRTMWSTGFPLHRSWFVSCDLTHFGFEPSPIFNPQTVVPYSTYKWMSPTLDQAKALIAGWTGDSPNQWLVNNTRAVPPEQSNSPSFADIFNSKCVASNHFPWMWTRTSTGKTGEFRGERYKLYYLLNLKDGTVPAPSLQGGVSEDRFPFNTFANWVFVVRELDKGEQYYWY